jgi:tRNA U34 2-thiouridine synthase MnmA/TrmU
MAGDRYRPSLSLLSLADYDYNAGHYARNRLSPEPTLLRARDNNKDQSYYLSAIPAASLARTLFPLGELTKPQVRALAAQHRLPTAARPESMGICFVGEKRRFSEFIGMRTLLAKRRMGMLKRAVAQYIQPKPGPIVDLATGKTIGQHKGLWTFTIGEAARISGAPQKMYVARKDVTANAIFAVAGMYV